MGWEVPVVPGSTLGMQSFPRGPVLVSVGSIWLGDNCGASLPSSVDVDNVEVEEWWAFFGAKATPEEAHHFLGMALGSQEERELLQ